MHERMLAQTLANASSQNAPMFAPAISHINFIFSTIRMQQNTEIMCEIPHGAVFALSITSNPEAVPCLPMRANMHKTEHKYF